MKTLQECLVSAENIRNRSGRGPKLSTDWDAVVRAWFQIGNQHAVAEALGLQQQHVSRILRRVGVHAGRGKRKPVHQLPMDEVAERYRAGESTVVLGNQYGVDPEVIRRRLLKHGETMRHRGDYERKGPDNPQWKGASPQVREYHKLARRIAEFCLGKTLPRGSVVHHQDEDERNNHPSNLWVLPTSSAHLRYHQQQLKTLVATDSAEAIRLVSENGGQALPLPDDLTPLSLDTSRQFPYDTRVRVENALRASGILQGKLVRLRERRR